MSTSVTSDRPDVSGAAARPGAVEGISLRGVSKRYGGQTALRGIDLEIGDGEFFCLLGPSGCGKTTTLNLIGGFVAPTEGTIWIRGERVDRLPPHRRDVNTVFQSYALFPHMSVSQNVEFGLKMARVDRAEARGRADEALALVGLESFGERTPAQLSGGQQQRVAVARALVRRPAVLLLDEPLGALDLKLRQRLQVELSQIHREVGTTFVYVTHDQQEAMSMADRIAVMNHGRIEQLGTPTQIYRRPTSRFVADFIGDSNFFAVGRSDSPGTVVELVDGTRVPCAQATGGGALGRADLMVRPEAIRIAEPGDAPAGALLGRVLHTSFLGNHVRVAVACAAATGPVLVAVQGDAAGEVSHLNSDKEVALWWQADDAVLIVDNPEVDKEE